MTDASRDRLLRLHHDDLCVELAPEVGGSIARFYSQRGGARQHWLRPATEAALTAADPLRMGSFPLVPWCNRIRDGRSAYGARPIDLAPNLKDSPHTIHGIGWRRAWQVAQAAPQEATLVLEHRPVAGSRDWPYAFDARQQFTLDVDGLAVEIGLTNRSDDPMPAGIGHHPYFPHTAGTRLTARVNAMWASDADLLPTRLTQPGFLARMAQGIELSELDLDNNFTGWSREAVVEWPTSGAALSMRADAPFDFFVLYCPKGVDHFVMEPVSNCTDWMNLAARGVGDAGGMLLPPGATLSGRFRLQPLA